MIFVCYLDIPPDCTDCDFTSICDRDSPCMNGGQCIQYSPASNYTCNCTGSYTGYNCSGIYRLI